RDVSPAAFEAVRAKIDPKLIPVLEGEEGRGERTMGRIFGGALPSGASARELTSDASRYARLSRTRRNSWSS
ncbi:MAG: hypothetical protein M3Z23_05885, partial [Acidobacteriota bacterium]|nr:hypothetical protein [Acidobacteriota bacterium]